MSTPIRFGPEPPPNPKVVLLRRSKKFEETTEGAGEGADRGFASSAALLATIPRFPFAS